jgi:nucleoid-associated protein YgaU
VVAISPAGTYPASIPSLPLRRVLAALVLAAVLGSLAVAALAGMRDRSGTVSLDSAGPSIARPARPADVDAPTRPVAAEVHVVQPGDTLWTIARAFQPTGDVRPLVAELSKAMGNHPLQPGQRVTRP